MPFFSPDGEQTDCPLLLYVSRPCMAGDDTTDILDRSYDKAFVIASMTKVS